MDRPSEQRRRGERRRLWDRRAPGSRRRSDERRNAGHRTSTEGAPSDRRAADRRAATDRRAASRRAGRRRRETPTPFTADEIATLRARFAAPGAVDCPACGSRFSLGPARRRGAETARRVVCLGCSRAAVVPHSVAARLLLVSGNTALRDMLQAALAGAGHEVVEAADTAVALAAYQTVPADVIVMDTQAPGRLDAPEFLRQLRRAFPDIRVVALAGRPSYREVDPLAASGLGAVRALRVPFTREQLLQALTEVRP